MNRFKPPETVHRHAALLSAYGVQFGVQSDTSAVLDGLSERLPTDWLRPVPASRLRDARLQRLFTVVVDDQVRIFDSNGEVGPPRPLQEALDKLRTEIQLDLAEWAPGHVLVHAGVIGWNGRAVMFPGRSFAGKSTLVAALVQAGATYYSDELAVLDEDGRVHPYARPLGIRADDGRVSLRTAEQLGGIVGIDPLPLGTVVMTRYLPEAVWRPRRAAPGFTATRLMGLSLSMRRHPERAISVLALACSRARCARGTRGEPDAVVSWLQADCPLDESEQFASPAYADTMHEHAL